MKRTLTICGAGVFFCTYPALCQEAVPKKDTVPLYSVTVIERTTKAINYQYRAEPTKIDFVGTVLMHEAKGEATVGSKRGRTEIEVKFANVAPPSRFGREYLTYVLWAITPEGAPRNLGEVVPDGSNKAKMFVTTDLQAFGLIVTAEPYSATRQPSEVVVMENEIRPDTVGKIQPIQAKYELMPRGHYTWEVPDKLKSTVTGLPKISMDQYEALLEIYEAQNAVGIAQTANAEQYAPHTFEKAQQLLAQAQRLQATRAPSGTVVEEAREAVQTAEDARVIAERRRQEEKIAAADGEVARAQQAAIQAQGEAQRALAEADAARNEAQAERSARERAEADAAAARDSAAQAAINAQAALAPPPPPPPQNNQKGELRMQLLEQLNGVISTRDTPRGLVATVTDSSFSGSELRGPAFDQLVRIAAIVAPYPGLRLEAEGHTDSAATDAMSWRRAEAVRRILVGRGVPAGRVSVRGLGDSRPLVSNSSPGGREQNRRVEIVISGDPIGSLPFWDRTYSPMSRR